MSDYQTRFRIYDQFYTTDGDVGDPCVYCGCQSTGFDHVPPLHFAERIPADLRYRFRFRLLPACRECNSWLSGLLLGKLSRRRQLDQENDPEEVSQDSDTCLIGARMNSLAYPIRSGLHIVAHLKFREGVRQRIDWMKN